MTVPLAIDGNLILAGEVVNITVGADNPQGVINLSGELFIETDITPRTFEGTITPVGTLIGIKIGHGCFDTTYDECIEATDAELDCVGACEEVVLPPEPPCPECPECQECPPEPEPCPECPECPPIVVSNCNDVLRILSTKLHAWHLVRCGVFSSGGGEVGEFILENFDSYNDLSDMQANGWSLTNNYTNPLNASAGISTGGEPISSPNTLAVSIDGPVAVTPGGVYKWTKTFVLTPSTTYDFRVWCRQTAKRWWENTVGFDVNGEFGNNAFSRYHGDYPIAGPDGPWKDLWIPAITVDGTGAAVVDLRMQNIGNDCIIYYDNLRAIGVIPNEFVTWEDMSGRGNHLNWISGNKPVQAGTLIEGFSSIRFNNAYMEWPAGFLAGVGTLEAFIVVKSNALGSGLWRLGSDAAAGTLFPDGSGNILDNFGSTARNDFGAALFDLTTDFRIYHVKATGIGEIEALLNGQLQAGPIGNTFALPATAELGRSNGPIAGNFDVAEVIIATELTNEERASTLDILTTRWGLTL